MELFKTHFLQAVHFLKFRPRSEKEIRDKLREKKAPEEIIERIIFTLKKQKFLDDKEFALWWIRQRNAFRPKSKMVIKRELLQKGIAKEIINEVFSSADDEHAIDDLTQAKRLAKQKIARMKGIPANKLREKLTSFLARRGYDWDTIRQSVDDVIKEEYNKKDCSNSDSY